MSSLMEDGSTNNGDADGSQNMQQRIILRSADTYINIPKALIYILFSGLNSIKGRDAPKIVELFMGMGVYAGLCVSRCDSAILTLIFRKRTKSCN